MDSFMHHPVAWSEDDLPNLDKDPYRHKVRDVFKGYVESVAPDLVESATNVYMTNSFDKQTMDILAIEYLENGITRYFSVWYDGNEYTSLVPETSLYNEGVYYMELAKLVTNDGIRVTIRHERPGTGTISFQDPDGSKATSFPYFCVSKIDRRYKVEGILVRDGVDSGNIKSMIVDNFFTEVYPTPFPGIFTFKVRYNKWSDEWNTLKDIAFLEDGELYINNDLPLCSHTILRSLLHQTGGYINFVKGSICLIKRSTKEEKKIVESVNGVLHKYTNSHSLTMGCEYLSFPTCSLSHFFPSSNEKTAVTAMKTETDNKTKKSPRRRKFFSNGTTFSQ